MTAVTGGPGRQQPPVIGRADGVGGLGSLTAALRAELGLIIHQPGARR